MLTQTDIHSGNARHMIQGQLKNYDCLSRSTPLSNELFPGGADVDLELLSCVSKDRKKKG